MFEDALRQAEILDDELNKGIKRSELHGIPLSIKDTISCRNTVTTFGCSFWVDNIKFEESELEVLLKGYGMIPFVKTNVPQLMMIPDTTN